MPQGLCICFNPLLERLSFHCSLKTFTSCFLSLTRLSATFLLESYTILTFPWRSLVLSYFRSFLGMYNQMFVISNQHLLNAMGLAPRSLPNTRAEIFVEQMNYLCFTCMDPQFQAWVRGLECKGPRLVWGSLCQVSHLLKDVIKGRLDFLMDSWMGNMLVCIICVWIQLLLFNFLLSEICGPLPHDFGLEAWHCLLFLHLE